MKRAIVIALALSGVLVANAAGQSRGDTSDEQRELCVTMLTAVTSPQMLAAFSDEELLHDLCGYNFAIAVGRQRGQVIPECDALQQIFTREAFDKRRLDRSQAQVQCKAQLETELGKKIAPASEASVCVKYGPCPLDVSSFACTDIARSSFVRRVCYDEPKSFMVIKLNETWYPYCSVDAATVAKLLSAESVGSFYNQAIRSRPDGSNGPFDCRDHPLPSYPR
jgi:hypothetical protein